MLFKFRSVCVWRGCGRLATANSQIQHWNLGVRQVLAFFLNFIYFFLILWSEFSAGKKHAQTSCRLKLFVLVAFVSWQGKPSPFPALPASSLSRRDPLQGFWMLWSLPSLAAADKETVEGKGNTTWWEGRIFPQLPLVRALHWEKIWCRGWRAAPGLGWAAGRRAQFGLLLNLFLNKPYA